MTMYVEVFRGKDGWQVKEEFKEKLLTSESFDTIEDAEAWANKQYEHCWIDHKIEGHRGHLIRIDRWIAACEQHAFIDYDGHGDLVDENYEMREGWSYWKPSDITQKRKELPVDAKYVLWYNR